MAAAMDQNPEGTDSIGWARTEIKYHAIVPIPKGLLAEKLEKNLQAHNVQIIVGDKIFLCNHSVLVAYSRHFAKTLEVGDTIKLTTGMTATTFGLVYAWMINKDPLCPSDELVSLLISAYFLESRRLSRSILESFNEARNFTAREDYYCYLEAVETGIDGLAKLWLARASQYFLVLVAAPGFRQLSAHRVYELLSSNHLGVHSEIEVFYAAVIWLYDDYTSRRQHIKHLLSAIRFNLLPSYLVLHWADNVAELKEEMAQELRVCLKETMLLQMEHRAVPSNDWPTPRVWITDPMCPYHKDAKLDAYIYLSMQQFIGYLKLLQTSESTFINRIRILPSRKSPANDNEFTEPSRKFEHYESYDFINKSNNPAITQTGKKPDLRWKFF
ncbi:actin-binding protein IPP [Drosophila obscura]|uniref:actin-binding protein IPP n=1 Tax=Drosophila obscura TaxID=7282 RepID=UPI001BB2870B|nr:actin-binding protein IPP [Drosophila obscura]